MSRHVAREKALQMLFQLDVGKNSLDLAKLTLDEANLNPSIVNFALQLVEGTVEHMTEFDDYIKHYASKWDVERIANVDKNAIRMALYEMKYLTDIPLKVSINEAVELVKEYSTEQSGKFVNGILDQIKNDLNLQ